MTKRAPKEVSCKVYVYMTHKGNKFLKIMKTEKGYDAYVEIDYKITGKVVFEYVCDKVDEKGMHVSEVKIYDEPKELAEFNKSCNAYGNCMYCKKAGFNGGKCTGIVKHPPATFVYVEEIEQ